MTAEREPFVGPVPFAQEDAWRFFGREDASEDLFSLLLASRVLLLYAQSGAGKTSIIHAGLLPRAERERFNILPIARLQGSLPTGDSSLEVANPYTFCVLNSWTTHAKGMATECPTISAALTALPRPAGPFGDPAQRLMIIDQFEELFTSFPDAWNERPGFVADLANALETDPRLHLLLSLREDYLADILDLAEIFPDELRTQYRLSRLGEQEAIQAVEMPVNAAGKVFADGVVQRLVDDLRITRAETRPGVAADIRGEFIEAVQLQVVCSALWRSLSPGTSVITHEQLTKSGDVTTVLASFYDDAVRETQRRTGVSQQSLRAWFDEALITPSGTRSMAYRGVDATQGLPNAAVDVLEDLHMIRAEVRAGARWYELTHDRFIAPIQSSNSRVRLLQRAPYWGVFPLIVGTTACILLAVLGLNSGFLDFVLRFASIGLVAVGVSQLALAALSRRDARRRSAGVSRSRAAWHWIVRLTLVGLGLLCMLGGIGLLFNSPEDDPFQTFYDYVRNSLGSTVLLAGAPDCMGTNLGVFVTHPNATVDGVTVFQPSDVAQGDEILTSLADNYCEQEASSNVWTALSAFWLGGLLIFTVVRRWLIARRRRRAISESTVPAGFDLLPASAAPEKARARIG